MSNLAESFLTFLLEKKKETGKNRFNRIDYMSFDNYEMALDELVGNGLIKKANDIVDTIILCSPENE